MRKWVVAVMILAGCVSLVAQARGEDPPAAGLAAKLTLAESALATVTERLARLEQQAAVLHAARAAPGQPPAVPPPEGGERVVDELDRFTGERRMALLPRHVLAKHRSADSSWAILQVAWTLEAGEDRPPVHTLQLRSTGPTRRWPDATRVYLLLDGRRSSSDARTALEDGVPAGAERLDLVLDEPQVTALVAGKQVDVRAGDWEFEVPPEFRRDLTALLARFTTSSTPR